jgi:hypothetical protein
MSRLSVLCVVALLPAAAAAQLQLGPRLSPGGIPVLEPPAPPPPAVPVTAGDVLSPGGTRTTEPARAADVLTGDAPTPRGGQQHWLSLNFGSLQPMTARVGVKVWDRPNGSLWVEGYAGSVLFDWMVGAGVRLQYTAAEFGYGDKLMIAPGVGAHILPTWEAAQRRYYRGSWGWGGGGYYEYDYERSPLVFVAADVDISWVHQFSPRFAFELGTKLGVAGRVSGQVGRYYPSYVMFGRDFYPVISFYTGFRF